MKEDSFRKSWEIAFKRNFDNLKIRISRELSNIDTHKFKKGVKETFWMFYFIPIMGSLITALIILVLHVDYYFLILVVMLAGYCLQNLLFFMKFGKRKKNFHSGSE